jgi:MOSC domain-containing protein YiiM
VAPSGRKVIVRAGQTGLDRWSNAKIASMGLVEGIHIAAEEAARCEPVERVRALAGRGIEGDRHFGEHEPGSGHDLTLIAAESLEALKAEHDIELAPGESRRQVTTRGVDVNALVGRRFTVGTVEAVGIELCEPCNHLQSLTQPGVMRGLVHRAGINADVIKDGEIAIGDGVVDRGPADADC